MKMVLSLTVFVVYVIEFSLGNETVELISNSSSQCQPFEWMENGEVSVTTVNYRGNLVDLLNVKCKHGFDLMGPLQIPCVDGVWEMSQKPKCAMRCTRPPFLNNGDVDIDGEEVETGMYKKGTLATYSCKDGFVLSPPDSQYRVCERGIWTGANVTCAPVERVTHCKPVENITNGYIIHEKMDESNSFLIGQSVQHACKAGYRLEGEAIQRCLEDGRWAPKVLPVCISKVEQIMTSHCSSTPTFPHTFSKAVGGFPYITSSDSDAEVEIYCLPRYRNINSPCEPARLRCIGGQWMGIPPNCVLVNECRCPPKVALGTPFILTPTAFETEKGCRYPINTSISYLCVPGYELEGYSSIMTCGAGGCWEPPVPPICKIKQHYYYLETNGGEPIVFSLATGAGVLLLLVIACLIIVCRKRKPLSRAVAMPPPVPRPDLTDHASLLHPPDRLALIAFADGMQVGQSGLPTYEEATRDRNLGITSSRLQRPPWPSLIGRRSRNSPNPDNILFTRQGSFASHSASTRSGGDPMGSTDTMAVSENSTTVTLDTASSHSGSQPASCRAHCGSLASFDTSSVLNTEGVPLLEESELEEIQCGETVSLAMENRSMCDNSSYKLSTASDLA